MNLNQTEILARLESVTKVGPNKYSARCPAHNDKNPSLSLRFTDTHVLLYCHAGCEYHDIVESIGLRQTHYPSVQRSISAVYERPHRPEIDPKVIWREAREALPNQAYLVRKGIKPIGIKQFQDTLIIPLFNSDGDLASLQYIYADGNKKFHSGRSYKGLYTVIGDLTDAPIYLCEGYATGVSLHLMTGHTVVCCMTSGNYDPVAAMLKEWGHTVVIAADNDHRNAVNGGLIKAQRAADLVHADLVTIVPCGVDCQCSDFNDVANCKSAGGDL